MELQLKPTPFLGTLLPPRIPSFLKNKFKAVLLRQAKLLVHSLQESHGDQRLPHMTE